MSEEPVILEAADGKTAPAVAELVRYSPGARRWRAAMFIAGGVLLGVTCSAVPGPHMLITFWLLPLAGIWLARRALRTEVKVVQIEGTCPACGRSVELFGGSAAEPRECRRCQTSLTLTYPEPQSS